MLINVVNKWNCYWTTP